MNILDSKLTLQVSGGAEGFLGDIQDGAQVGSGLGLVAGAFVGAKASGFALATYEFVPYAGWCLVSAGKGSFVGLAAKTALGAYAGFWGGALVGGALVVGYAVNSLAYNALKS